MNYQIYMKSNKKALDPICFDVKNENILNKIYKVISAYASKKKISTTNISKSEVDIYFKDMELDRSIKLIMINNIYKVHDIITLINKMNTELSKEDCPMVVFKKDIMTIHDLLWKGKDIIFTTVRNAIIYAIKKGQQDNKIFNNIILRSNQIDNLNISQAVMDIKYLDELNEFNASIIPNSGGLVILNRKLPVYPDLGILEICIDEYICEMSNRFIINSNISTDEDIYINKIQYKTRTGVVELKCNPMKIGSKYMFGIVLNEKIFECEDMLLLLVEKENMQLVSK